MTFFGDEQLFEAFCFWSCWYKIYALTTSAIFVTTPRIDFIHAAAILELKGGLGGWALKLSKVKSRGRFH